MGWMACQGRPLRDEADTRRDQSDSQPARGRDLFMKEELSDQGQQNVSQRCRWEYVGEIGPGKVQFDAIGARTAPVASMTVTDLTVTGFVPTFVTLHSLPAPTDPSPVARMVAFAVPPRIIPARIVHTHTLRDIDILLVVRVVSQEPPEQDAFDPFTSAAPKLGWRLRGIQSHG